MDTSAGQIVLWSSLFATVFGRAEELFGLLLATRAQNGSARIHLAVAKPLSRYQSDEEQRTTRMTTREQWLRGALVATVLIHCIVTLWHGATHAQVPVPLSATQIAIVVATLALPLLGAGLLWTTHKRAAAWLIAVSMLGSLLFGFINHFVIVEGISYPPLPLFTSPSRVVGVSFGAGEKPVSAPRVVAEGPQ